MTRGPDALSFVRVLLAPALVSALAVGAHGVATLALAAAAASDVLDGWLARRLARAQAPGGAPRPTGAYVDVAADAVFLLSGLTTLWLLGQAPAWLPLLALAVLVRFVVTSAHGRLVYDPVGRHFGTLLYVVLAVWSVGAPDGWRRGALAVVALAAVATLVGRRVHLARRPASGPGA